MYTDINAQMLRIITCNTTDGTFNVLEPGRFGITQFSTNVQLPL